MIAKFREEFIDGAHATRARQDEGRANCSSMIEKFAGYGFNKSHSTAYALIAYMTAYLKAHYPVEFMAALLSGDIPGRNFKKQGFAGRASGRLPADGHRGRAAGREPLGRRFHRRRRQDSVRPVRDQRLRQRRGRGDRRRTRDRTGRSRACSTSANGSIRSRATARRSKR